MKEQKCENCGSNDLKLYAGKYTCEHCGSVFAAESSDGITADQLRYFEIEGDTVVEYRGFDRTVEISEGITTVAEGAFDYKRIRTLKCPKSVTAFEGSLEKCKDLVNFEAPGLKKISSKLLSKNKTIKKVVLENVREVSQSAFVGCSALTEVIIPNATTIKASAFQDCTALKEISLPNVTTIGKAAFRSSGLCSITAPKVREIKEYGFQWCRGLKEIKFPELETVGEGGFCSCDNVTHIMLPKVKTAAFHAFACKNLVHIEAPQLEKLEHSVFEGCSSLKKVVLPSVQSIDECAFWNCEELTEVVCENATLIANEHGNYNQFVGCPKLVTIKLKEMPNKKRILKDFETNQKSGCYVATCVYGSYDCPQVWTLRRYRDNTLAATWYGRLFVHTYYAISPTIVKWFGETKWFKNIWKGRLDAIVSKLQARGFESTPYEDRKW